MARTVWWPLLATLGLLAGGCPATPQHDDDAGDDDTTGDDDATGDDDTAGDDDDTGDDDSSGDDDSTGDDDTGDDDTGDDDTGDDDTTAGDPCGPPDLAVTSPYPIAGYWMYGRLGECAWRDALETVHRIGADTVIQFGPHPARRTPAELATDPTFSACDDNGDSCFDGALFTLQAAHPDNTIRHVYTMATGEDFGDELLVCPGYDARIEVGDQVFWRLLLRAGDAGDDSCDFATPRDYDLLLLAGNPEDSVASLLAEAQVMGMEAYLGIPTATPHPSYPWEVWSEAEDLCLALVDRVAADYADRHGGLSSFAGVYQSTELPVADPTVASVLDWYEASNQRIRQHLPGRAILVSPYMDLRRQEPTGVSLDSLAEGFKDIARTDMDVIAPQDGRGTGKVGLYWPFEEDSPVDPRLEPAVGPLTYGSAYRGNTRDAYDAVSAAADQLLGEGIAVDLWVNVEAFEPGGTQDCGYYGQVPLTEKERLDQALTFEGASGSRLISFMWDAYYTCTGDDPTTLGEDVASDHGRPIVAQAFAWESANTPGLVLRGYGITGGDVGLTWYDGAWAVQSATVPTASGWENPGFGAGDATYPDRLEEVWIPFDWSNMAPDFYLHISVTTAAGTSTHLHSLAY